MRALKPLALALSLALATPALADWATLTADSITLSGRDTLTASGAVEVIYQGRRLRAQSVTYDQTAGRLIITGPLTLTEGTETVLLASEAELDDDLRNGVLRSARTVLNRQLQLAAAEVARIDGRYTRFDRAVASTCRVCTDGATPLWEIRAQRIIHDDLERQLYFENAQFRLAGVPLMIFPRLRMPGPGVTRARGMLPPRLRSSSRLGTGIELPYFVPLGKHSDVTLTPRITSRGKALITRYRQAFTNGTVVLEGALAYDDLKDYRRGYLLGRGRFDIGPGTELGFDIESASDNDALSDYGVSEADRLETRAYVTHTDQYVHANLGLSIFESLRDEDSDLLPRYIAYGNVEQHMPLRFGRLEFSASGASLYRPADDTGPGRDLSRLGGALDWVAEGVSGPGLVWHLRAGVAAQRYTISQDNEFTSNTTRFTPRASATLRFPLVKHTARATHLLEPVAQLAWSRTDGSDIPNEDSRLVTLDPGNLFSLTRFPGVDRIEEGWRANLGLQYSRIMPSGWQADVLAGRILRRDPADFPVGSGLDGTRSDWLLAARLSGPGVQVQNQLLVDDDFSVSRNELRLSLMHGRGDLDGTWLWQEASPEQDRPEDTHQVALSAGLDLTRHWRIEAEGLYDITETEARRGKLGVIYRNECINVDFSVSRRLSSSSNVASDTDLSLGVKLGGFSGGSDADFPSRRCAR